MTDYPKDNIKIKELKNAALRVKIEGREFELGKCGAEVRAVKRERNICLSGRSEKYTVIDYSADLLICFDFKNNIKIDIDFLQQVEEFALKFESFVVKEGECRIEINELADIIPKVIEIDGEWEFDISKYKEKFKNLFW